MKTKLLFSIFLATALPVLAQTSGTSTSPGYSNATDTGKADAAAPISSGSIDSGGATGIVPAATPVTGTGNGGTNNVTGGMTGGTGGAGGNTSGNANGASVVAPTPSPSPSSTPKK